MINLNILPYTLLAITISSLFFTSRLWPLLLAITVCSGIAVSTLSPLAVGAVGLGLLLAMLIQKAEYRDSSLIASKWVLLILHLLLILWSVAIAAHLLPGFNNLLVLDKVKTSQDAIPFTLYLNFDKPMVIFPLLLVIPGLMGNKIITEKRVTLWLLIPCGMLIAFMLGWWANLVKPEFKLPGWWWLFVINNLIFTCTAEEAFFRGYLQQKLTQHLGWVPAWLLASVLFGIAHFAGGVVFVGLATLAGLVYGLAFYFSGRLWVAILIHLLFNLLHLLLFTYPMLAHSN